MIMYTEEEDEAGPRRMYTLFIFFLLFLLRTNSSAVFFFREDEAHWLGWKCEKQQHNTFTRRKVKNARRNEKILTHTLYYFNFLLLLTRFLFISRSLARVLRAREARQMKGKTLLLAPLLIFVSQEKKFVQVARRH